MLITQTLLDTLTAQAKAMKSAAISSRQNARVPASWCLWANGITWSASKADQSSWKGRMERESRQGKKKY